MKFEKFSEKQKVVFTWWSKKSPFRDYKGIICDGSVRSGKTLSMAMSFVFWAMSSFDNVQFGISSKSVGAAERNIIFWLIPALKGRGFQVKYTGNCLVVTFIKDKKSITNYFYVFGGKDKTSYTTIQGLTAGGWFFDEAALQPENFVNQAMSRCSVEGSKFWLNCNPDNPFHWLKTEFIDKANEKKLLHLHFLMYDNPSLSKETINSYENMFSGVFYLRYIKGLWVMSEGIIFDSFSQEKNTYSAELNPDFKIRSDRYLSIDYGISNPFAALEIFDGWDVIYIDDMIYYDSKKSSTPKQLTDNHYLKMVQDMEKKCPIPYNGIIVDPSALSLIQLLRMNGYAVIPADNNVLEGIKVTHSAFYQRKIMINSNNCEDLLSELNAYVWDEKAKERGDEKPIKANDHACDALRYFVNTKMKNRILNML